MSSVRAPITTHVLNTVLGKPAAHLEFTLFYHNDAGQLESLGDGMTDTDGRGKLLEGSPLRRGVYSVRFDTGKYFKSINIIGFYPRAEICFEVLDPLDHYHIALLLTSWSYTTYRGS